MPDPNIYKPAKHHDKYLEGMPDAADDIGVIFKTVICSLCKEHKSLIPRNNTYTIHFNEEYHTEEVHHNLKRYDCPM